MTTESFDIYHWQTFADCLNNATTIWSYSFLQFFVEYDPLREYT
jgi:hypothetical protein